MVMRPAFSRRPFLKMTAATAINAGYPHVVACILSDRARETGHRQVYDHPRREFREG